MNVRSWFAAFVGGMVLCASLTTAPVGASEPLRVVPAVRTVESGASAAPLVEVRHRLRGYGGGYYGRPLIGGYSGWGYRSVGFGPRYGIGGSRFFGGGLYRSSFYSPYGYGLGPPYGVGLYGGYRAGFGAYYSGYRPGFNRFYAGYAPAVYTAPAVYATPALYGYPAAYGYSFTPYAYAAPVYAAPVYGYTAPVYTGSALYGGYNWDGCY